MRRILFTASLLILLSTGSASLQPENVEKVTLRLELNTSEAFNEEGPAPPGLQPSAGFPFLSTPEPRGIVPFGETNRTTNIYGPGEELLAYFPLEDRSGSDDSTVLPDASGTVTGTTVTEAWVGDGLEFDGTDDSIVIGDKVEPGNITISAWVRHESRNQDNEIVSKLGDDGDFDQYGVGVTSNQEYYFYVRSLGDGDNRIETSPGVVSADTWEHVAVTYNGTTMRIYANASIEAQERFPSSGTGSISSYDSDLEIGSRNSGQNDTFNGTIDDVRIYGEALSQKEIRRLKNYKKGRPAEEQLSATLTSGGFLLTNTEGGTPSIKSREQEVKSRSLLDRIDPSFAFPFGNLPETLVTYDSPFNLTGAGFTASSGTITIRNTAGIGENATVEIIG